MPNITLRELCIGLFLLILGSVIKIGKRIAENIIKNQMNSGFLTKKEHEVYTKINNKLIEILIGSESDRVYVFMFHNGEEIAGRISRKKISCMFEACADGVTSEIANLKDIDVTIVWTWLKNFQTEKSKDMITGVMHLTNNQHCNKCVINKRPIHFEVAEMPPDNIRAILEQQGIYSMIQALILSHDGNIMGILGIDYCTKIDTTNYNQCDLCSEATHISLLLTELSKVKTTLWQYIKTLLEK